MSKHGRLNLEFFIIVTLTNENLLDLVRVLPDLGGTIMNEEV